MATHDQIQSWKDQLPDDLAYGTFADDFDVDGTHYEHGAWNSGGDYWMAWNTDAEFRSQLALVEFPE